MEHFSKQVIDSRQVFIGFPQGKPNMFSLVSVGFEKCLPEFLVERVSYPEIGRTNFEIEFTTIEFIIAGNGKLFLGGSNSEFLFPRIFFSGVRISNCIFGKLFFQVSEFRIDFHGKSRVSVYKGPCGRRKF